MYYSTKNISQTVKNDLCVGCGICEPSCPEDAITIKFNEDLEYRPVVDKELCTDCGICQKSCPMDIRNLSSRIDRSFREKENFGLDDNNLFFQGYASNNEEYFGSSSGGVLSTLVKHLLETGQIDAIVHAEKLPGRNSEKYFRASISYSAEEIDSKRGSFYYPIEYSGVLEKIANDDTIRSVAIISIPCALSGISNLRKQNKKIDGKIKYLFSLVCGHNASGQFAEKLSKNLSGNQNPVYLNFRDKEGIIKAANFNNSVVFPDGEKIKNSRFATNFTIDWRTGAFSWNACFFCPDFWGETSDASFKDAWGVITQRKEGETLFHLKNKSLLPVINEMVSEGKIIVQEIEKERFVNSQGNTLREKTEDIAVRINNHSVLKSRFSYLPDHPAKFFKKLVYHIKRRVLKGSKKRWRRSRKSQSLLFLKIREFILRKADGMIHILTSGKYHDGKEKEVLYTAGFGYGNIGDEAQLRTNLNIWREQEGYKITLLSPNPNQTRKLHGNYDILLASRLSFWGVKGVEYSGIGNRPIFRLYFSIKYLFLKINAFTLKHFGFTAFLRPEASFLLQRLKKASVLHIGGGGFLMGKTSSRLYDFMGLVKLMKYFGNDVILSGQNIGSFSHWYQEFMAKNLRKADFIGLRDKTDSVKDLEKLKIPKERIFPLFDDALFCDQLDDNDFYERLSDLGIQKRDKYIAVNVHYWKVDKETVNTCLDILARRLDSLIADGYQVLLVPMDPNDRSAIYRLKNAMCEKPPVLMYDMNVPLLVAAFRNAYLTLTMKHHPIIFSMSGSVPVISVAFEDYYFHKNEGALELFGQQQFALKFSPEFEKNLINKINYVFLNYKDINGNLKAIIKDFETRKGLIIHSYIKSRTSYLKNSTKG